jgi:hypothetical protein
LQGQGQGSLWADKLSLMPEDNLRGWRREGVEAIRDVHSGGSPMTPQLARRVVHSRLAASCAHAARHPASAMTVTWRGPGLPRKSPSTPAWVVTRAATRRSIGVRATMHRAIPASSAIFDAGGAKRP